MASRRFVGSLDPNFEPVNNNMYMRQNRLIRDEENLVRKNNRAVRVRHVAPGNKTNYHPRLRRKYNKYGSKGKLTPGYVPDEYGNGSMVDNPDLTRVRGRYTTQRQCKYVPKLALMKMAKDMDIAPFDRSKTQDFKKGSELWSEYKTDDICEAMRSKYISKPRKPIKGMTAYRNRVIRVLRDLKQVQRSLEFVASRLQVSLVGNDNKSKSLLKLSNDIANKLRQR
jgi:hypothetical protein